MISPIGSIEEIFMGWTNIYELTPMIFSILIWTSFSLFVFYKASNLNFIPYVQVVPLRAAFDTSFRYQVQRQQYLLNRMGRFSVPISLEEAPRNLILFFAKESLVRTLRFGDLFGLVIAIIFLNMPSLLTNISEGSQQAFLQQSFLTVSFVSIFFPIILTQLWITEFSDYFWIVKTSLVKTHYYIMGIFLWQLILYIPTTLILHALNALFVGSIDVQSIFISLLLSFTTSSFGVFYGIWVVKRKSFTPYVFMTGMFFFLLVALPIIVTTLVGRIFSLQSSYALVFNVIPLVYSLVSTIAFLLIADKMFRSMDI
jgi:hypothetical protein